MFVHVLIACKYANIGLNVRNCNLNWKYVAKLIHFKDNKSS